MAYSFQTYSVGQVLTAAQMNQEEVNIRDHVHGESGVGGTTRTIFPGSHAVYDLGTTALHYRKGYIDDLPQVAQLKELRFYEDFLYDASPVGSPYYRSLVNSNYIYGWVDEAFGTGTDIFTNASSRGYLQLSIQDGQNNIARIIRAERWANWEWASLVYKARVQVNRWGAASVLYSWGFADKTTINPAVSVTSADGAVWSTIASAAISPVTRLGAGQTVGNSLAFPAGTVAVLGVTLSSGQAQFSINNSLWQTLTTNIPSSKYLSAVTEVVNTLNATGSAGMMLYEIEVTVNST